jgi:hypothetical protein
LTENPKGRDHLEEPTHRLKYNIKIDVKGIAYGAVD